MCKLSLFTPLGRFIAAAFLIDLCVGAVGVGLQFMGKGLRASPVELGLIGALAAAAYTAGCLISGRASDRIGRRISLSFACIGASCAWAFVPGATQPWQVMVLGAWSGGCMSFFWPVYQAWMADITVGGRRQLNRNIGLFNLAWTSGVVLGPVVAGVLWPLGPGVVFWSVGGVAMCGLLLILCTPSRVPGGGVVDEADDYERAHPLVNALLRLAWIAGFVAGAVSGLIRTTFPNLGLTIGYSWAAVGVLLAFPYLGQLIVFAVARTTDRWQNRKWPLSASMMIAAVGVLCAYAFQAKAVYALAFVLCGSAQAAAFVSSQFYTLHGRKEGRGRMAGFHEAVIGAGFFVGPLIGGSVAQYFSLRTPYLAAAILCLAGILVAKAAWRPLAQRARAV